MRTQNRVFSAMILVSALVLASCTNPSSSSPSTNPKSPLSLKNVPSKIAVNIPKSLDPASSASQSLLASRSGSWSAATSGSTHSYAYDQVKSNVSQMGGNLYMTMFMLVVADDLIGGLSPSATSHPGKTVTITQEMIDLVNASVPASFVADAADIGLALTPGMGGDLPSFVYDKVTKTAALPYDLKFEFTMTQGGMTTTYSIYWDSTRTNVMTKQVFTGDQEGIMVVNYDGTNKLSAMVFDVTFQGGHYTDSVRIKEQADTASQAKHGVYVFFDHSSASATDGNYAYSAEGVADDSGGYLTETSLFAPSSRPPQKTYYRESFDGAGTQTGSSYSTNGSTWTTNSGTLDQTYANEYTSEASQIDTAQAQADANSQITADSLTSSSYFQLTSTDTTTYKNGYVFLIYGAAIGYTNLPALNSDWTTALSSGGSLITGLIGSAFCESDGTIDLYLQTGKAPGTTVHLYQFTPPTDSTSTGSFASFADHSLTLP